MRSLRLGQSRSGADRDLDARGAGPTFARQVSQPGAEDLPSVSEYVATMLHELEGRDMAAPWILHASDPHLGDVSPGQKLDDDKQVLEAQPDLETTQTVFKRTLRALGRFVKDNGKPEVAVVSGDLAYQATPAALTRSELLFVRADIFPENGRRSSWSREP